MGLFTQLCRNTGLMIHHIIRPDSERSRKREVGRSVEEKQVDATVTLRRTTIDEIEVRQPR